jgi:selenocysteine lyase/cysteine desulfurase
MDWDAFRAEFPVTRNWAYFDHAAVAPWSEPARRAMTEWADDLTANGDVVEPRWLARLAEVRQLVGRLLHADPLDIAFLKNTSEGISLVAEGFPWRPGDNVVTAAEEYPSNQYPWMHLASRGVETRRVASRHNRLAIDDLAAAIDARTRILSLSAVEFSSGFRNDLEAVGELCRTRGIFFFVDAIQALGVFPIDVQQLPIDALAADGHKWLVAPEGAAIFYLRRDQLEAIRPTGVGWNSVMGCRDFSTIDLTLKPHAGRFESGTLNMGGIHALGASIDLLLRVGVEAIAQRVLDLTDHLCVQAAARGISVFSSRRHLDRSGIVSLETPGVTPRELVRRCRSAGIVVNQRAGRLRVSPHAYNTTEELDRLVEVIGS